MKQEEFNEFCAEWAYQLTDKSGCKITPEDCIKTIAQTKPYQPKHIQDMIDLAIIWLEEPQEININ